AEHGTMVAGFAAAVTDNMTGIAGTSWNCTIMPVNAAARSAQNDSTLQFAFEGVTYAADNGADIINASWSFETSSNFGQDVIDLAHESGALVIAAASNDGTNNDESPHVPANLNHVLSVGATSSSNVKANFSNYGVTVDVFAPGVSLLSTLLDDQYGRGSGTSFATPIVCGIAGLLKTRHPDWSMVQVREQIRVTSESIDGSNPGFAGKLGKGEVNALRALTVTGLPSIRVVGATVTDSGGDGRVEMGEVADMAVQFVNYLEGASNISLTVSTTDPNISFTNATGNIAAVGSGDTATVVFQFELIDDVQDGYSFNFFTDMSGSNYSDRDFTEVTFNPPEFANHDTGPLQTTITTQGNIGFVGFADETPGVGFVLNGSNILFEGGLMIGTGQNRVSDSIRGTDDAAQDDDFKSISVLSLVTPGQFADEEGRVVLDDGLADAPLGVQITQESYAYSDELFNEFVIFRYFIKNESGAPITGMYVGLFFDWDISVNGQSDFARFDQGRKMGVVQNRESAPTLLAATRILTSPGVTSYRSIHNPDEIYSTGNGFTDSEKWNFLSNGIQTRTVDNNDVSTLTSTGPFSLDPDEGVEVAFAVIGAASTDDLNESSYLAQFLWDNDLMPVVDQDPPVVSTSILQNPVLSKYADIVVVADRLLASPPEVTVQQGSNTTNVAMSLIAGAESAYRGPFEFAQSGSYSIETHATGFINGVDSTQDRSFIVALVNPGVDATVSTHDKKATVFVKASSVSQPTYFIADYETTDKEAVFRFGPVIELLQPVQLEIQFDDQAYSEVDKLFIYRQAQDGWRRLDSQVFPERKTVRALVGTLGNFKISHDGSFDGSNLVPDSYALKPNYPNPFNPSTTIEYDLPNNEHVILAVYNTLGQLVRTLVDAEQPAGGHRINWDGTNQGGRPVSTGVYFYSLRTENFSKTLKMILMR
ncbi:S8 family serine peptidase, partial [bacterium]|nr:S8 family serine peptidase [bacterium]